MSDPGDEMFEHETYPLSFGVGKDLEYLEQADAHAGEGPLGEAAARSILAIALRLARAAHADQSHIAGGAAQGQPVLHDQKANGHDLRELSERARASITALRTPDPSLARVPNTVRQSIADVIEGLVAAK